MKHGSLFSGIGGFDLAAEWMGWENVFHCEWNEFGQKILKHYWPNAISYTDITKTDFTIHRGTIDILSGGFPCQPYSAAGKRLGTKDDRHLWPEMLRAIREIQPGYVVGENVRGLTNWNGGLVFDQVQADLEAEGYEVLPFLLPACAVDAPHRRDRIWFVAYNSNAGTQRMRHGRENKIPESEFTTNAEIMGRGRGWCERIGRDWLENEVRQGQCHDKGFSESGITPNTSNQGLQGNKFRQTPEPGKGRQQTFGSVTEFHKSSDWTNFPTQSPVCSRNDGVSARLDGITFPKWRNESIKGYGNAIVPQVAYQIFKAIELI